MLHKGSMGFKSWSIRSNGVPESQGNALGTSFIQPVILLEQNITAGKYSKPKGI